MKLSEEWVVGEVCYSLRGVSLKCRVKINDVMMRQQGIQAPNAKMTVVRFCEEGV